tara:strand:+ start:636 stop:1643 length:1008 start_codon:yes stop_codon:yes gene_type:complete
MKKYLLNQNLTTGILISESSTKEIKLSEIQGSKDVLFILPNELISFVEFRHDLKNKKNIHAALTNKISPLDLNKETPKVLDTNDPYVFFLVNKQNMDVIDRLLKDFDENIRITSDLLFFKEIHGQDLIFNDNIFLFGKEESVKLSKKSLKLLDLDESKLMPVKNNDLHRDTENKFYTLNTFKVNSIFNKKFIHRIGYVSAGLIILFSAVGFININSNNKQINQMENVLSDLFSEMFPNEEIIDLRNQIENKLNDLSVSNQSKLSRALDITNEIALKANILEINYTDESILFKCNFKNDSEESIFINQLKRMNINLNIDNRENNQIGVVTKFVYEL